ncbi:Outer membrane protein OmpA [Burkholderia sp. YR290]|jgi:outer membrane protein OmpA-like peptidoglycan-associated protein|uniref:OmpA family protein n=1 Tax=Paraburkholderia hospita TaxID=169430 RepID=UPI0009A5A8C9|nr:OmpA family protein [Paraburkholderia hospita]SKC90277.1 Outer membrane protein OmpA [Paraburkholderia hospita]SOE86294.1 Outer membrane protein OmpA [Burkholderia sp. YR290]
MKKLLTIAACALSLSMLAACSGLDRSKEEALNQQAGIEVTQTKEGVQVRLPEKVLFNFNESSLRPDAGPAIGRVVVVLSRTQKPMIVEGHTDNVGTREYNQQLSEARAKSVADELERRGISASRITLVGYAFDRPVADNDTPDGRARNRRTEIVVKGESLEAVMGK